MDAFITIGSVGLDLIHLILFVTAAALAGVLVWMRGELQTRAGDVERDLADARAVWHDAVGVEQPHSTSWHACDHGAER